MAWFNANSNLKFNIPQIVLGESGSADAGASANNKITLDVSKFKTLTIGMVSSNTSDSTYYCYMAILANGSYLARYVRTGTNLSYDVSNYDFVVLQLQSSAYTAGRSITLSNVCLS